MLAIISTYKTLPIFCTVYKADDGELATKAYKFGDATALKHVSCRKLLCQEEKFQFPSQHAIASMGELCSLTRWYLPTTLPSKVI